MYIVLICLRLQCNLNFFISTIRLKHFITIVLISGTALQKPSMLQCTHNMKTHQKTQKIKHFFLVPCKFYIKIKKHCYCFTSNFNKNYQLIANSVSTLHTSSYYFVLESNHICCNINPLKTKRRQLYLKTQSVPRCKHFFFNPLKTSADRFI